MMKQNIKNLQSNLIDFLDSKICNTYEVCSEISIIDKDPNKIYSPFVLALIGVILLPLRSNKKINILAQRIYEKLSDTANNNGLFNFYGNKEYYYDVDTTAIVNTFFFDYCRKIPDKTKTLHLILENQDDHDGSVYTWMDRENNNIDWFVNFNVYVFFKKIGCHKNKLIDYLKNNTEKFFHNGSRYYKDITIPLFIMYFYFDQKFIDDNDFGISKYFNIIDKLSNKNVILSGLALLRKNKKNTTEFDELLKLLNETWHHEVRCFNSSKAFYISTELNAAISLYLLNKMETLENG